MDYRRQTSVIMPLTTFYVWIHRHAVGCISDPGREEKPQTDRVTDPPPDTHGFPPAQFSINGVLGRRGLPVEGGMPESGTD